MANIYDCNVNSVGNFNVEILYNINSYILVS